MSSVCDFFQKTGKKIPEKFAEIDLFPTLIRKKSLRFSFYKYIIQKKSEKVKRKCEKNSINVKNSIFIDEKIYSVDRLKNKRSNTANGFTYSKVRQN